MNVDTCREAVQEAERSLAAVRALDARVKEERSREQRARDENNWVNPYLGSRESAAVKRASLDLTRVLAKLRRT